MSDISVKQLRGNPGRGPKGLLREETARFLYEEEGLGTVEIILIIFVLIGLVIIFKDRITSLVNQIFESITSESDEITAGY